MIRLLALRPGMIHNDRLGGGYHGDTETPENFIPANRQFHRAPPDWLFF